MRLLISSSVEVPVAVSRPLFTIIENLALGVARLAGGELIGRGVGGDRGGRFGHVPLTRAESLVKLSSASFDIARATLCRREVVRKPP
jgi:hypothetical protein